MRKLILLICICSSAMSGYSQAWENVNIDSGIRVSLPKGYRKIDTLKDYSITARANFGNILITKVSDVPFITPDIYKKRHLDKYYRQYVRNILTSSKGDILIEKDTMLGKLRVKDLTVQIKTIGDTKIRKFRILHENSATYTFQFIYEEVSKEYAQEECNRFFNSISLIRDFDLESQYTKLREGQKRTFFTVNNIGIGIGIVVLMVLIIFLIRKKNQGNE